MGNELIRKEQLKLRYIPNELVDDFEAMVLEAYCDNRWLDIHSIGRSVDIFAIYSYSQAETGDPYQYADDEEYEYLRADNFDSVLIDVSNVLNHHRMFHGLIDRGDMLYQLENVNHSYVTEVW